MTYTALSGFAILLIFHRRRSREVWGRIDWSVLIFFGGLFVSVDGSCEAARRRASSRTTRSSDAPGRSARMAADGGVFFVGSNVVTNVPFILLVRDEMAKLPDVRLGWELLAMASTFAGNLTLLGSVANIIVSEKVAGSRRVEVRRICEGRRAHRLGHDRHRHPLAHAHPLSWASNPRSNPIFSLYAARHIEVQTIGRRCAKRRPSERRRGARGAIALLARPLRSAAPPPRRSPWSAQHPCFKSGRRSAPPARLPQVLPVTG